jgi:hypothetical protein
MGLPELPYQYLFGVRTGSMPDAQFRLKVRVRLELDMKVGVRNKLCVHLRVNEQCVVTQQNPDDSRFIVFESMAWGGLFGSDRRRTSAG